MELRPYSRGFRVEVEIDFDNPLIGRQALSLDVTPDSFRREIARARTFGFMRDVSKLWSAGYALGATFDNTLVNSGTRYWAPTCASSAAPVGPAAAGLATSGGSSTQRTTRWMPSRSRNRSSSWRPP